MHWLKNLIRPLAALGLAAGLVWVCALSIYGAPLATAEDKPPGPEDIRGDVWKVVEAKCLRCHGAQRKQARLDMSTKAAMLAGGVSGPAFVSGKAEKSLMIDLIDFDEMPPRREKPRVTKTELDLLRAWINSGAPGRMPPDKSRQSP